MGAEQFDWQTIVSLLIVGIAIVIMLRRMVGSLRQPDNGGCNSCSSCAHSTPGIKTIDLLQLGKDTHKLES